MLPSSCLRPSTSPCQRLSKTWRNGQWPAPASSVLLLREAGPGPGLSLSSLSLGPHGQRGQSGSQKQRKIPRGARCSLANQAWAPAEGNRTCRDEPQPGPCLPLGSPGILGDGDPGQVHALRMKASESLVTLLPPPPLPQPSPDQFKDSTTGLPRPRRPLPLCSPGLSPRSQLSFPEAPWPAGSILPPLLALCPLFSWEVTINDNENLCGSGRGKRGGQAAAWTCGLHAHHLYLREGR